MGREKIVAALNTARSDELASIHQYMGHHYRAEGPESPAVVGLFEAAAKDEMKHAEMLAERIVALGGEPTTDRGEIRKGRDLREMVAADLEGERQAIARYREQVRLCVELDDPVTRLLLERILTDEERHADLWESILGRR